MLNAMHAILVISMERAIVHCCFSSHPTFCMHAMQLQLAEMAHIPVQGGARGKLHVRLARASSLQAADRNGLSDPYVKLTLGGVTQKTRMLKKTLDPVYNETFIFYGTFGELTANPIQLIVMDHDLTSFDDMIGIASVDLKEADSGREYYPGAEKDFRAELDTQGSVFFQVWWTDDEYDQATEDTRSDTWSSRLLCVISLGISRFCRTTPNERLAVSTVKKKGACRHFCGPVLHPDSRFRSGWNVALAFFICYCGIGVPLEIAFESDMVDAMCGVGEAKKLRADCPDFQLWFWGNFFIDMWFICDIVVNFRTGYVKEGHFVSDGWLAAKKYMQGSFLMDCLGTFPLNILLMIINPDNPYGDIIEEVDTASNTDVGRVNRMLRLLRMAKLAKLARMAKLAKYMENFEEFLNPGVLVVIKLVMISLFCCHWFGCMWWLVSDLELTIDTLATPEFAGDNNWHPPEWLKEEADLATKYTHSFYWGAGMVTSFVPRDIEPTTPLEAMVTSFTMFFGVLLNAYLISSLTQALATMDSKKELVGKQLSLMKNYLVLKSVPSDLRSRILDYHEYLFTSSAAFADMNMFEHMPPALTAQLNLATNRKLVTRCAFFRDVSNSTLVGLLSELHPLVAVPDQLITFEGNVLEAAYFIHRGRIRLEKKDVKEVPKVILNNDNFGMEDFVTSRVNKKPATASATARAITYCDLVSLSCDALSRALVNDPQFEETVANRRRIAQRSPTSRLGAPLSKWKSGKLSRSGSTSSAESAAAMERATCLRLAQAVASAKQSPPGGSSSGSGSMLTAPPLPPPVASEPNRVQTAMLRAASRLQEEQQGASCSDRSGSSGDQLQA